jgi:hypothetical protein
MKYKREMKLERERGESCVEGNQYETLPLDHIVKSAHSHTSPRAGDQYLLILICSLSRPKAGCVRFTEVDV